MSSISLVFDVERLPVSYRFDADVALLAMHEMGDHGGGRCDADGQHVFAEQCIHHGRFAMVELTEHDERDLALFERRNAVQKHFAMKRGESGGLGDLTQLEQQVRDLRDRDRQPRDRRIDVGGRWQIVIFLCLCLCL